MSEATFNAFLTIMVVAFFVVATALIVAGGVWCLYFLVISLINSISEREKEETE